MALGKKTGGRKPGTPNRTERALAEATAAATAKVDAVLLEPFQGDAHAFLMLVYRDMTLPIDNRLYAARAAIRYEKPALSNTDGSLKVDVSGGFTWHPPS